jgi:hypothetical protein
LRWKLQYATALGGILLSFRGQNLLNPHSPDDALICATITPIQIRA